jgi:hypothetical protein
MSSIPQGAYATWKVRANQVPDVDNMVSTKRREPEKNTPQQPYYPHVYKKCKCFPLLAAVNDFYLLALLSNVRSQDCIVDIATGYGLDDQGVGVRALVGSGIFSSPCQPDRLWGPHSLLFNGYRRLFGYWELFL